MKCHENILLSLGDSVFGIIPSITFSVNRFRSALLSDGYDINCAFSLLLNKTKGW